jgi:hypothetical protein
LKLEASMYLHQIPLETRPQGAGIVSSEGDTPFGAAVALEPEIQGVNIGCYMRFREEHIFSCSQP